MLACCPPPLAAKVFQCGSGSSFLSQFGSGSRGPNQCGYDPGHKKLNFYTKKYLMKAINQKHTYEGTIAF
jgi:hypothetical protein